MRRVHFSHFPPPQSTLWRQLRPALIVILPEKHIFIWGCAWYKESQKLDLLFNARWTSRQIAATALYDVKHDCCAAFSNEPVSKCLTSWFTLVVYFRRKSSIIMIFWVNFDTILHTEACYQTQTLVLEVKSRVDFIFRTFVSINALCHVRLILFLLRQPT